MKLKTLFEEEARHQPQNPLSKKILKSKLQKEKERIVKAIEIELAWLTRELNTSFNKGQKKAFDKVLQIIKKGGDR